jgi:2-methylcitrate dehydratase PrpD
LDIDDGHRAAVGHPGAAIIPAAFAVGEQVSSTSSAVLAAIAVGYEVAIRAGTALRISKTAIIGTGHWCSFGVAATAAALRSLTLRQTASAIALAGALAPRLVRLSDAGDLKEGIPWATYTGLVAADMAAAGAPGPVGILDDDTVFDCDVAVHDLGRAEPLIGTTYFKLYSCCRWAHAAIEAISDILSHAEIVVADIEEIAIGTFGRALTLPNDVEPQSLERAQYSVPFCVSVAAALGAEALMPLVPTALGIARVTRLARRVHLYVDPELDRLFPAKVAARVTVRTRTSTFARTVTDPRGDLSRPLTWDDLVAKFDTLACDALSASRRCEIIDAVRTFGTSEPIERFTRLLRSDR